MSGSELVMKSVSVLSDMTSTSQDGISYTSDQVTYPADLDRVPEDAYQRSRGALWLYKQQQFYEDDSIQFSLRGYFRELEDLVIGDDHVDAMPVMANVDIYLDRVEKSGLTEVEVSFRAERQPHGTPEDPRIRFLCEGHFDAAGGGDTRFHAVLEVDQRADVNVVEQWIIGGDGELSNNSPNGLIVKFPFGM